jgi:archaeal flagellar protein FlaJ
MRFQNSYFIGIGIGVAIFLIDILFFLKNSYFVPILVLAIVAGSIQFWVDFFIENQRQKEIESRFLDFVRNLAGAVKSGMPVSRAIIHISKMDYGALSPYAQKLGHQVDWSIPVHKALLYFSNATRNDVIKRTIATVSEAEQSGGNMEDVLESITTSLIEIKKIKEQRRASVHSQVMQSYIIFFIFLGVMILIQNMLMPYLIGSNSPGGGMFSQISGGMSASTVQTPTTASIEMDSEIRFDSFKGFSVSLMHWFTTMRGIFLMLSVLQGFFAGITIGKMAEGDFVSGLKHSLVLSVMSLFIMSIAR